MTELFKYPLKTADAALRGNMGSASFMERGRGNAKIWTRRDAIASAQRARPEMVKAYKPRIARVKRLPSIGGFHVVGFGQVPQLTLKELQTKLGANGYTGYRVGGLVFKLFKAA